MFLKLKYLLFRSIVKYSKSSKVKIDGKLRATKVKILGENNSFEIEDRAFLKNSKISVKGNNNKILIKKGCDLKNVKIFMEENNSEIIVGENTTCAGAKILSQEGKKVVLGQSCILSYDIEIRNCDSHKIYSKETNERINPAKDIIIGDRVWIGMRAIILKGSEVGDDSIIAAGSIIVGKVDRNSIVAGVPGNEIKNDIYWER
ncbi:MAG: acyltransferase [Cetobacterium sp.]|uniref:acyltransferase n=1 Tax=Cetobacterium sp. TaxID=2071632 RepID=UPI003F3345BF